MRWQKVVAWWSLLVAAWAGIKALRQVLRQHDVRQTYKAPEGTRKVIDVTSREVK
jgi:hypothetical protein